MKNSKDETPPKDAALAIPPSPIHVVSERHNPLDDVVRRRRQASHGYYAVPKPQDEDMMGPILRRKKVVSLPIGSNDNDLFFGCSSFVQLDQSTLSFSRNEANEIRRASSREDSWPRRSSRKKSGSLVNGIIRRRQVSLDLYAPSGVDFFGAPIESELTTNDVPIAPGELPTTPEDQDFEVSEQEVEPKSKLFKPLQFSPPMKASAVKGSDCHGVAPTISGPVIDNVTRTTLEQQEKHQQMLKIQIDMLTDKLEGTCDAEYTKLFDDIQETQGRIEADTKTLKSKLIDEEDQRAALKTETGTAATSAIDEEDFDTSHILKATRRDYVWTGVLLCLMIALTGTVVGWKTHHNETFSTFGAVGLACATPCYGDIETHDYFAGHSHFESGEFIQLIMSVDPYPEEDVEAIVEIIGSDTGHVKSRLVLGPMDSHEPSRFKEKIEVDFEEPHEEHIITVTSSADAKLTYTLHASKLTPLAKYSEVIAALIMISVYLLILLEVVHRTLVAIFGSMVALLFLFITHEGETESIRTIMLNMEWSTLGLLFGMMLIVGELSHTGIFEWLAVRLLVASKGSYNRLFVLLCLLTAIASAFLDNVTTMLLVAPVTIDMCNILGVDPRPYLIGEVILSNVGGTATLIGDPPNIIIGSAFQEIGFVDFIINILPCIFFFCIPVCIALSMYIYRFYLTSSEMPEIDKPKLMRTYQVYDEPRLLIAGTVAFFVILIFFLHPLHHKDTAWIALLGAFITITFTNPHDVQDALRNHVEWDTLLFFAGLFVLVEVCATLGLLEAIGDALASYIADQPENKQLTVAITLLIWVSSITSAFLDNIPYTATMIPVIRILSAQLPDTLPIETLAWALSFGACLGGNGTLLGASANIVTAGIASNKGFEISFLNFFYPGMIIMIASVAIANLYMLIVFVWV